MYLIIRRCPCISLRITIIDTLFYWVDQLLLLEYDLDLFSFTALAILRLFKSATIH